MFWLICFEGSRICSYDSQSREIKTIDGKGTETAMSYDEEGRMTAVIQDAAGSKITTAVSYTDPTVTDNMTSATITLANGSKSKTVTNVQGLTTLESTIGGSSSIDKNYQYTYAGNVLRQTDSAGNYRVYEYDSADRQTAVNYFDKNGSQTLRSEFTYDANGNVTVMEDYSYENGSKALYRYTEKRYDGFGRLISEAEADANGSVPPASALAARSITYTYDSDDRLTAVTYPSGFDSNISGLAYEYGDYSRLAKISVVTDSGEDTLREYTYDSRGRVATIKESRTALGGTGYSLKTYSYDRLDRPAGITITDSEKDGTAEEYTYTYDENSRIVKETKLNLYPEEGTGRINETWDYVYDRLGRLTTTTVTDDTSGTVKTQKTYTYDSAGNRLTETENGQTMTNTYNLLNQMVESGGNSYTYDANGNQTQESSAGLVREYNYDADNRLDTVTVTENDQITLQQKNTYNGEGQRISKTENGEQTTYAYQGGSVVYTDGSSEKQSLNIMGDAGNVIACERDTDSGKAYYYYNKDMRGSTTSILDGSGNCQAAYEYSDFGETAVNSDFYNEIAYTGCIWDQSTGLYYLNARYYDPDDGRFLTEDTVRPEAEDSLTWHLYAYCANNPVNYVDLSGHGVWGFYSKSQGYFAFNQNAPQKYFGYYPAYDFVAPLFGIKIMEYVVNTGKWKLELWKGQYGKMKIPTLHGFISTNFSNGCEIGLYYKSGWLWKCAYPKNRRLRMKMSLYIGNKKIFSRDSKTSTVQGKAWWLNAFKPSLLLPGGKAVLASKLTMKGTIYFGTNSYSQDMKKLSMKFFDQAKSSKKMTVGGSRNSWRTRSFTWK